MEFHRAAGGVDQRRIHQIRPANRRADHRAPLRRSRRAQAGESLGNRARADCELAQAAERMIRAKAGVKLSSRKPPTGPAEGQPDDSCSKAIRSVLTRETPRAANSLPR